MKLSQLGSVRGAPMIRRKLEHFVMSYVSEWVTGVLVGPSAAGYGYGTLQTSGRLGLCCSIRGLDLGMRTECDDTVDRLVLSAMLIVAS